MQVLVSGQQIDVSDALRRQIDARLHSGIGKYFDNPIDAHVAFSREGREFRVVCSVHVGHDLYAQAQASGDEIQTIFEQAADRLESRLRRYKRRLRGHRGRERPASEELRAKSYVLEAASEHEEAPEEFQPVIVAENLSDIIGRTVGEAVMQLELADLPALMFRNPGNGHLNVVYRRPDRHIGWIDLVATEPDADDGF